MPLRELLAVFDIQVDTKKLTELDAGITKTAQSLANFGKVLLGGFVLKGVTDFIEGQIASAAESKVMAERLGVTVQELKRFTYAAQLSGATSEEAANGLRFLNKNIGEAATAGSDAGQEFVRLGVSLKDAAGNALPVTDVAAQLADKFQGMTSQGERTATAMKLLGRGGAALLPLFQEGSQGIREAYADLGTLTGGLSGDFAEAAHKAEQQLVRFHVVTGAFKRQLTMALLPAFTATIAKMTTMGASINKLVAHSNAGKVGLAVLGAGAVFAAVRFLLLNAEVALVALAVAAFALIIEDLYTLFTGGNSLIGAFIDSLFGVGAAAQAVAYVKGTVDELWTALKQLGPVVDALAPILKEAFGEALVTQVSIWKGLIESTVTVIRTMVELLFKAMGLTGKIASFGGDKLKALGGALGIHQGDGLAEGLQSAGANLSGLAEVHELGDAAGYAPRVMRPSIPAAGEGKPTNVSQENKTTIILNGIKDAKGAVSGVKGALADTHQNDLRNALGALSRTAPAT